MSKLSVYNVMKAFKQLITVLYKDVSLPRFFFLTPHCLQLISHVSLGREGVICLQIRILGFSLQWLRFQWA